MQKFYVIAVEDKDNVNFQEVAQSQEHLRYSLDKTKFVIKQLADKPEPSFILSGLLTPLFTFDSNRLFLESAEYENNWKSPEEIV